MITTLKKWWPRVKGSALLRHIFSRSLGYLIPYTGTISPHITMLEKGQAQVLLKPHRRILNHLGSIHALALANLGEFCTGLVLHFSLPSNHRAILTHLQVEYLKKARGPITAKAVFNPSSDMTGSHVLQADLMDVKHAVVARIFATWLVDEKGRPKSGT